MKFQFAFVSLGLSLMVALPVLGAPEENLMIVPRTKQILEDSSEHRRSEKNYLLTAQLAGSAVAPVPAAGVTVGKYLDRNSIVELEGTKGVRPYVMFDLGATTVGLNYKRFFGNSFFAKLGVVYRKISLSNIDLFYYQNPSTIGSAESLNASLAIGNQWQWENFTLGCDWIGVNPTVSVLKANYDTTGIRQEDKKELDESWEKLAKVTSWQLLRFHIGASF